jgi:hypothetical protein
MNPRILFLVVSAALVVVVGCPTPSAGPGEGEGEGETSVGEGEGEGDTSKGEGEGEGEGDVGEGEGEGEGDVGPVGTEVCDNGTDDDGDFVVDCFDTDCDNTPPCSEVCGNGEDDDGDFAIDCADSSCDADEACRPPDVTDDLGDRDTPTTVSFPYSEIVANLDDNGEECVEVIVPAGFVGRVEALTESPACLAEQEDTQIRVFRNPGADNVTRDDDGDESRGFCSELDVELPQGDYAICAEQVRDGVLQPVRFDVNLTL